MDQKRNCISFGEQYCKDNDFIILCKLSSGIVPIRGKSAGELTNVVWVVTNKEREEFCAMYCHHGEGSCMTIFDKDDYNKVMSVDGRCRSWYRGKNGYITTRIKTGVRYLHQQIMNHYGNGRGKASVDHINKNMLDNRRINLRITTQSEQNRNRGKVTRHKNAKKLPEEADRLQKEGKVPTHIYPKGDPQYRADGSLSYVKWYYVIDHPKRKGIMKSKMGKNVSFTEKLEDAIKKLRDFESTLT